MAAAIGESIGLGAPLVLARGLSDEEVLDSRSKHGANKLPEDRPRPFVVYLLLEFLQPLIVILLFLLALTLYKLIGAMQQGKRVDLETWVKLAIILLVVSLVTTFNALGNSATGKALGRLAELAGAKRTRVRRNSCECEVLAEELVVGDVVLVRSGDVVQADIRVAETSDLACIEAALTGEPTECKKTMHPVDPSAPFLSSMLYSGTSVVCGHGCGVVTAVGPATEIGQIAQKLDKVEALETPVQKTMRRLGAGLILLVLLMLGVFAYLIATWEQYDVAKYDNNKTLAVLFEALSLAQILLPTTLMLTVTVNLRRGVLLLKQHNAVLRRFTAVETLGCTTVICSDKTGTLTEGKMTAVSCVTVTASATSCPDLATFSFHPTRGFDPAGGLYPAEELGAAQGGGVLGAGVVAEGSISNMIADGADNLYPKSELANLGDKAVAEATNPLPRALVGAAFLNSSLDTRIERQADGTWTCIGNTSEAALVVAAAKVGMWQEGTGGLGKPQEDVIALHPAEPRLEVPFTSGRKMKLTVHAAQAGSFLGLPLPPGATHVGVLKGAPDRVLPCCQRALLADLSGTAPLDAAFRQCLSRGNLALAEGGLRVLAVATLPLGSEQVASLSELADADERLQWFKDQGAIILGLMGLEDPPRDGVKEAVAACHRAGVKVVMITGDQAATAASIAKKIGIVRFGEDASELSHECSALHTDPDDPTESKYRPAEDIDALTRDTLVWARAQPVDKIAIVESLQRQGAVAAMTGDGVNDAAALKAADIGTAMGIAGTEVAKAASDMILLDDNFSTIVAAVREGRHIYGNLQKYVYFYLGVKLCELVMFTACVFLGVPKPVGAIRALLAKNITHDTTPMTLTAEVAEPYQMRVPPRPRTEFIMTPHLFGIRLLPQLLWFSAVLLGGGAHMSAQLLGSPTPKRATAKVADWMDARQGNCLKAYVCKPKDGKLNCKAQSDVFVCKSRLDGAWLYEFGQVGDDVAPEDWNDWKGKLVGAKAHDHDVANSFRRWTILGEASFDYEDRVRNQTFPAVRPCSLQGAKAGWEELFATDGAASGPDAGACWTQEATDFFALGFPKLVADVNRVDWAFRTLQGTQFLCFVLLELAVLLACRTEDFFWRAPVNRWFFKVAGTGVAFAALLIYIPGLNRGCEMAPVGFRGWCLALGGAGIGLALMEVAKAVYKRNLTSRQLTAAAANPFMNPAPVKAVPV